MSNTTETIQYSTRQSKELEKIQTRHSGVAQNLMLLPKSSKPRKNISRDLPAITEKSDRPIEEQKIEEPAQVIELK